MLTSPLVTKPCAGSNSDLIPLFSGFLFLNTCTVQWLYNTPYYCRECSGSVVECSTRDLGVACSSLTGVTVLCP